MSCIEKFVKMLISQLGYTETGNNYTKYGKFFDTPKKDGGAWQFFNTHKNPAEWCALFLIYCFYICFGEEATRKAFNLPAPKYNCAAGVPHLYDYMKKAGLLIKEPRPGCIVFLNTTKKCAHVGACEYVDGKLHTIEGNKSNKVKRCTYTLNSSKIYAYAMPIFPDPGPDPKEVITVNVDELKKGSKGEQVATVQRILKQMGFYTMSVDKSYGNGTVEAVKKFQQFKKIKVDGICGNDTWNRLIKG